MKTAAEIVNKELGGNTPNWIAKNCKKAMKAYAEQAIDRFVELQDYHDGSITNDAVAEQVKKEL